jgi:hypothetical protein
VKQHATRTVPGPSADPSARLRSANRRTALVLLSIALVFFFGIIGSKFMGDGATGIGIMGTVVLLFLVVAIGRNLYGTAERAGRSQGPKGASARDAAGADARPYGLPSPTDEAPR